MDIPRTLRLAWCRATPARIWLLELLQSTPSIRSEDLRERFLWAFKTDTATYYRIITDFEQVGLIHTLRERAQEYIRLCEEIASDRIATASYELVHCHWCGDIEDNHAIVQSNHNILTDRREIHVTHCDHCHTL